MINLNKLYMYNYYIVINSGDGYNLCDRIFVLHIYFRNANKLVKFYIFFFRISLTYAYTIGRETLGKIRACFRKIGRIKTTIYTLPKTSKGSLYKPQPSVVLRFCRRSPRCTTPSCSFAIRRV